MLDGGLQASNIHTGSLEEKGSRPLRQNVAEDGLRRLSSPEDCTAPSFKKAEVHVHDALGQECHYLPCARGLLRGSGTPLSLAGLELEHQVRGQGGVPALQTQSTTHRWMRGGGSRVTDCEPAASCCAEQPHKTHLSGCLLHKALVCHPERLAQRLCGVMLKHLLVHQVHMEVDGGINGGIHSPVTIEYCEISLLLLIL